MNITLECVTANVSPRHTRCVSVELDQVEIDDIVKQVGVENLLDQIGKDAALEHFGVEEVA